MAREYKCDRCGNKITGNEEYFDFDMDVLLVGHDVAIKGDFCSKNCCIDYIINKLNGEKNDN